MVIIDLLDMEVVQSVAVEFESSWPPKFNLGSNKLIRYGIFIC